MCVAMRAQWKRKRPLTACGDMCRRDTVLFRTITPQSLFHNTTNPAPLSLFPYIGSRSRLHPRGGWRGGKTRTVGWVDRCRRSPQSEDYRSRDTSACNPRNADVRGYESPTEMEAPSYCMGRPVWDGRGSFFAQQHYILIPQHHQACPMHTTPHRPALTNSAWSEETSTRVWGASRRRRRQRSQTWGGWRVICRRGTCRGLCGRRRGRRCRRSRCRG
jgi:hypothetical protein